MKNKYNLQIGQSHFGPFKMNFYREMELDLEAPNFKLQTEEILKLIGAPLIIVEEDGTVVAHKMQLTRVTKRIEDSKFRFLLEFVEAGRYES